MKFNLVIIGSGPGGYVAAIRAAQLGKKVALIEKAELGGVCLNRGCIPTKALLKSAEVLNYAKTADSYGIEIESVKPNISKIVERSRGVSTAMSKGVEYLLKKNEVELIEGKAKLVSANKIEVDTKDGKIEVNTDNIILATGSSARELPSIPVDGKKVITYKEALFPQSIPETMVVVGSGAIGVELAYFYNSLGTKVTIVEYMPQIVPLEDADVAAQLSRSLRKEKMKILVSATVNSVNTTGDKCKVNISTKKGDEVIECDIVLSAVGVVPNTKNLGLENLGIELDRGFVKVNQYCATNIKGVYAIGDIIPTPALAHVASAEAILCVENMFGLDVEPIDYNCIPACIYTTPEVASVGLNEQKAIEKGYKVRVGKFPLTASGKATASSARDGFIKLVFDENTDKLLGASLIGHNVTEIIAELSLASRIGVTGKQIIKTIHPHPTISEAVMEAAADAHGEVIHV